MINLLMLGTIYHRRSWHGLTN